MAKGRAQRLQAVVFLARREEDGAAQKMTELRQMVVDEQQQLEQLQDYRKQYLREYQQQRSGVDPRVLMNYSSFLQRLSQAVAGQEQKLGQLEARLQEQRGVWQEKHHRRKTLDELIARLQREEEAALEQRVQRELDDMAAQLFSRDQ